MRCLYCGREIGALNLRRAGEFCSRDHRKNYGDRLNKALQRMAGPENPPAGVAGFAASWPAQNGCLLPSLHCWEPGKVYPLLPGLALPGMALGAANAADPVEQDPPLCLRAMPGLPAEPAAIFVKASTAQPAWFARSTRLPAYSMAAALSARIPPARSQWMPGPQAEPVESFVTAAVAANVPWLAKPPAFSMAANTATAVLVAAPLASAPLATAPPASAPLAAAPLATAVIATAPLSIAALAAAPLATRLPLP